MIVIGIDPDSKASGFALIDTKSKTIELKTIEFVPFIYDYVNELKNRFVSTAITVVIENISFTKHNWHIPYERTSSRIANAMGVDLGKCQLIQSLVTKVLEYNGYSVEPMHPLKKCWSGKSGKITHKEIVEIVNNAGYTLPRNRTNQEERDALLLACVCN